MTRTANPVLTRLLALALAASGAALGGCTMTGHPEDANASVPVDYRQRHPITIQERDRTLELLVGHARGVLTPSQRAEVSAFVSTWRRDATGGIIIDVPTNAPNADAAGHVAREIQSVLRAEGVPARAVVMRKYQPADPLVMATIRMNYPRIAADAGPCGLWPDDLGPSMNATHNYNRPYHNLGCATQRNMAAMVENPADLIQPRAETPAYAGRRNQVFEKYRKGESTATVYPDADKAKISETGK